MALTSRHKEIVTAAREAGGVTVDGLAERCDVTPQTIRRDLNELCTQGVLRRVHGGAVLGSGVANVGYEARRDMSAEAKDAMGRLCAAAVPDGSSLFMNIGTTTEAVARALLSHRDLLVITNNLNVANILAANEQCDVIVAGGMLRRSDSGLVGEATTDFIRQFRVDIAIVGASGIDDDGTLLDYDFREVRVAQAIIENARRTFLVADSSKFRRSAPVRIAGMADVDVFFTDRLTNRELRQACLQSDVEIREVAKSKPETNVGLVP